MREKFKQSHLILIGIFFILFISVTYLFFSNKSTLELKEFSTCKTISEDYVCSEKNVFNFGDKIMLLFIVESSSKDGQINLIENYVVRNTKREIIYDSSSKESFELNIKTDKKKESVSAVDAFFVHGSDEYGEYEVELTVKNPIFEKEIKEIKTFMIEKS